LFRQDILIEEPQDFESFLSEKMKTSGATRPVAVSASKSNRIGPVELLLSMQGEAIPSNATPNNKRISDEIPPIRKQKRAKKPIHPLRIHPRNWPELVSLIEINRMEVAESPSWTKTFEFRNFTGWHQNRQS
jgi:hypothetical protein